MGVLVSAPSVGAIPIGDPPIPTPPPSPTPPPPAHLPDLIVESVSHGYAGPYLGYYTDAKIRNQTNHDIYDTFYVRDDSSWNKTVRVTGGLPGGSHVTVRFYRYNCESSGIIHADAFRQIPESYENNNSRFWVLVC
jgi:hypothetical protein